MNMSDAVGNFQEANISARSRLITEDGILEISQELWNSPVYGETAISLLNDSGNAIGAFVLMIPESRKFCVALESNVSLHSF